MKQGRERAIEMVKRQLLRRSRPRLQMFLILSVTGAAGFLLSFALLHVGITRMWLRYPVVILLAYCIFLLILRFWLFSHSRMRRTNMDSSTPDIDASVLDLIPTDGLSSAAEAFKFGGGGDFGGGGAGGSWTESLSSMAEAPQGSGGGILSGGGGSSLDFDLDLDEGWLIILALVAIFGGLIASLYVVYIAPALLAEILADGLLMTGLYKRMKGAEQAKGAGQINWLRTAVRKTLLPALVVALFFSIGGYLFQRAVPTARSIGDVWKSQTTGKDER